MNFDHISKIVNECRIAQRDLQKKSNIFVNDLLNEIVSKILSKENNYYFSKLAVEETKFGNIKDKEFKNYNKTKNLIFDLNKKNLAELIFDKKKNIYKIYKPIGLICGVTPSTNPIATTLNYILNSIKAQNSIIICPNPRSYNTVNELIKTLRQILSKKKISKNIINIVPKNILRDDSIINLFNLCDKNIVTGSQQMISKVKQSSKPFLVFGTGNVPVFIDHSAKIKFAAKSIVLSKSFDNSTSCSADSVLIVDRKIYSKFVNELKKNNVYFLNKIEKQRLDKIYFNKGMINKSIIAKDANTILEKLDIKNRNKKYKIIAYEMGKFVNDHYIFNEKILPLVGVVSSKNIEETITLSQNILETNGKGHSAGIYSETKKNIVNFSQNIPVSRIIVNQPHSQSAGGSMNNYLNSTLSLGCGNWGNNILNDNLSLKDFCNLTKVVYPRKKI